MNSVLIPGVICVVLGHCLAGLSTTYATFLITQGLLFGLGLGLVSSRYNISFCRMLCVQNLISVLP